ncbi:acyl-CoA dehydrogenase family protein [Rhodococcus jostii]|uniref:Acyl-CoA dehydrogenase n=1 Tax=Rhodococcus jostii TaxID=132919 RepID=A0A1H5H7J0_RHOJO|nr:acyl-CoA dehydrogenase family protein [Rhodococcus jostii]SEE23962.1 Acyl-CoA dehydrogenase [Rhodococcus jostii]
MTLVLTDEQEELRSSVRKVIAAKCSIEQVRSFVASGGVDQPQGLWTAMAHQMGLAGIAIPDKYGGTGSGIREAAVVTEELGRGLAVAPFLSSIVLGGQALLALDDESARQDFLPSIADGTVRMTYAWSDHDSTSKRGVRSGPAGLTGTVPFALDGMTADHIVVETVDAGGELGFHLVSTTAPGLTRTELVSADPTRSVARLDFDGTPSRQLRSIEPESTRSRIIDHAAHALAAEQLGGIIRCVELTVEYAKVRVQFGRSIGSFQAVKHRLAEMYSVVELATGLVRDAGRAGDEDPAAFALAARSAFAYCSRQYPRLAREMIQLHGGIAYTWEHDAHFYYKRAHASGQMLGGPEPHENVVATLLGF